MIRIILYIIVFIGLNQSVFSQTYVEGSISGTNVWYEEESPYIIENDLTVQRESSLLIEAGVEVLIADNKLISVKGELICEGIPGKPIIFKAKNSYWGGIYIDRSTKNVKLSFTEFNSGGKNSFNQNSVILINQANISIEYCKFKNSYLYGITSFREGNADLGGGSLNSRGFNTFVGFSQNRWAVVNKSKIDIFAKNNCWGNDPANIISDYYTNSEYGKVIYEPESYNCEPTKPNKAILFFPQDSSKEMPVFLNLKWHKLTDISNYKLQLSEDVLFDSLIVNEEINDSIYAVNLKYGNKYFWRVRGINFVGNGEWSKTFTFVTYDTSKPSRVNLIMPDDSSVNICEVLFQWEEIENADEYQISVSQNEEVIDTLTDDNFILLNCFENSSIINWKVRAKNRNGYGKWSSERTFKIQESFAYKDSIDFKFDNLINIINTESGTIAVYSDSNSTTVHNITTLEKHNLSNPVDYYVLSYINRDSVLDEIYACKNKLFLKLDENNIKEITISGKIQNIQTADLNNNGKNEIICKINSDDTSYLQFFEWSSETLQYYDGTIPINTDAFFFLIDSDIDGDNDIVIINNSEIQIYQNLDGKFRLENYSISISNCKNAIKTDYNSDGYIDLILDKSDGIYLIKNNKGILENDVKLLDSNYRLISKSDFNNSSDPKIFVSDSSNNLFEYNLSNRTFEILNISGLFTHIINFNSDAKPDILSDNKIFVNNICNGISDFNSPENLRYSFIDNNSIMLEWDRSKLNLINNYNITYEIILNNNENDEQYNVSTKNNFYILKNLNDAGYNWKVRAVYNDILYSEYNTFQGLYTKNALPKPPDTWSYSSKTGLNTTILLREKGNINIDSLNPEYGDALGIFFIRDTSLVCGGYSYLNSDKVILTAWGDNQQTSETKDGFDYLENFRFKYWIASEKRDIPVNVEFEKGIGWFKPDTLSEIKSISNADTTFIYLKENNWNYISSDVIPFIPFFSKIEDMNGKNVTDIDNNMFDNSTDELHYWNTSIGYKIFTDKNDTISIYGSKIDAEYYPFKLNKNQWYLLPAVLSDTVLIDTALKSIMSKIKLLKDERGRIYSNEYNIRQFEYLFPNRSYEIILSENADFIFYKSNSNEIFPEIVENTENLIHQNSGNNSTLIALIKNHLPGEIKIYSDGMLVGHSVVNSDTVVISIKGKGLKGLIVGAEEGNDLTIIYSIKNGEKYLIKTHNIFNELTKQSESSYKYSQNSLHSINIDIQKVLSINNNNLLNVQISPNPVEKQLYIHSPEILSSIKIFDMSGRIRLSNSHPSNHYVFDMSFLPNGIYFVRIKADSKMDDIKIILNKE